MFLLGCPIFIMNKKNELALQVLTLAVLASKGLKIARLSGNRNFDEKVVKAKMKSMKANGMLVPAIILDAMKVIEAGLEIVDFETGEIISAADAARYVVLADANHRYKAHLNLLEANKDLKDEEKYKGEFYLIFALNEEIAISRMFSEINICTNPWKGGDFPKGAKMACKEKLPLLDFIVKLTEQGYPLPTASKWGTFKASITKEIMADAMAGKISDKLRKTNGLERGEKLLKAAAEHLSKEVLKSRTLVDWVINKYDEADDEQKVSVIDNLFAFFSSLSKEKAEQIEKAKGQRGGDTKETIINRLLNKFYEQFTQSQRTSTDE